MKTFLALILMIGSLYGQTTGGNVVNVPVVTYQVISATTTFNSPSLQNIGQTNHQLIVFLNYSSLSGSAGNISYVIQASIDGNLWFNISSYGNATLTVANAGVSTFYNTVGYLSYPYLRTSITVTFGSGFSGATIYANYQGNSAPASTVSDGFALNESMQTYGATITTDGSYHNAVSSLSTAYSFVIYGASLNLASTVTSFILTCRSTANDVVIWTLPTVAEEVHTNLVLGLRPYAKCPPGDNISYSAGGSGNNGLNIYYRLE
jgi:hypothetical protein